MFNNFIVALLLTTVAFVFSTTDLDCTTPDKYSGICVYDIECPPLLQIKNNRTRTHKDTLFYANSANPCEKDNEGIKFCCNIKNTTLCPNVFGSNVELTCYYKGSSTLCSSYMLNDVFVFPSCIPPFRPAIASSFNFIQCVNGTWNRPLPQCIRNCQVKWKCDSYLHINNEMYHVNSERVINNSEFIRNVFDRTVMEAKVDGISEFDSSTIQAVVDFLNTDQTDDWKLDQLLGIMLISQRLSIKSINDASVLFVRRKLNEQNYLQLLNTSKHLNNSPLTKEIIFYVVENFLILASKDQWLDLNVTDISDILKSNDLDVDSEEEVFEAVGKWLQKNPDRKIYTLDLLKLIRLDQLPSEYIIFEIGSLCTNEMVECKKFIASAVDQKSKTTSFTSIKRRKKVKILIIGGFSLPNINKVEVYDPNLDSSSNFADMEVNAYGYSSVFFDGKVFVFGGYLNLSSTVTNKVWAFNIRAKTSFELSPMSEKRKHSGAALIDGLVYVCGGYNQNKVTLNTVERYNPMTNEWTIEKPMPTRRTNHAVAVWKGKMYVAGGQGENREYLNSLDIYDSNLKQWTSGTPMQQKRSTFGLVAMNEGLYAIGGTKTTTKIEKLDLITLQWTHSKLSSAYREWDKVNAIAFGRKIICAVGNSKMFEYTPKKNQWKQLFERIVNRDFPNMILVPKELVGISLNIIDTISSLFKKI